MVYRLIDADPPPDSVREMTFVLFLPDGSCAAVPDERTGLRLPHGAVLPGEDYLLDTSLRVPLETAGFRMQRVGPFALDNGLAYAWLERELAGRTWAAGSRRSFSSASTCRRRSIL